jgi:hypothetical protein
MRRAILLFISTVIIACSGSYDDQLDVINYAYAEHVPNAKGAWCTHKTINNREYIGCPYQVSKYKKTALWILQGSTYYAVNGTARGDRETIGTYTDFKDMPLPLPADIDIPAAIKAFN